MGRLLDSAVDSKVETRPHIYGEVLDDRDLVDSIFNSISYSHPDVDTQLLYEIISDGVNEVQKSDYGLGEKELSGIMSECSSFIDRIRMSDEMGSLINAMNGGYTEPGPAGNMFRGKTGIYPTGRNLHTANPELLPTKASYRIGCELADELLREAVEAKDYTVTGIM